MRILLAVMVMVVMTIACGAPVAREVALPTATETAPPTVTPAPPLRQLIPTATPKPPP